MASSSALAIVPGQDYIVSKCESRRQATVLQSRFNSSTTPPYREVYVTYPGLDKRLDEWIKEELVLGLWGGTGEKPDETASPATAANSPATQTSDTPKTKTEIRHEKERNSLESELNGFRKRKRTDKDGQPRDLLVGKAVTDPDIEHHLLTRVRNFNQVRYASFDISTWYFSPYPISASEDGPLPSSKPPHPNSKAAKLLAAAAAAPATPPPPPTAAEVTTAVAPGATRLPGISRTTLRAHGRTSDLLAGGLGGGDDGGRGNLFVCGGCFKYMRDYESYDGHRRVCQSHHPPGTLVYENGGVSIWEVDGAKEKLYCQNLSLFGKLFIDQKTIFYSVEAFTFYVTTSAENSKFDTVVGFFSKEKISYDDYNLACIITFPPFQKQAFGRLMIEFSYHLTFTSPTPGTPERPLSDLGLKGYLSFWTSVLVNVLRKEFEPLGEAPQPPSTSSIAPAPTVALIAEPMAVKEPAVVGAAVGTRSRTTTADASSPAKPPIDLPSATSKTLTLASLAFKARLRLDDVALTLQEAGLLKYRQGLGGVGEGEGMEGPGEDGGKGGRGGGEGTAVVVTKEMVEELVRSRRVRVGGVMKVGCVRI